MRYNAFLSYSHTEDFRLAASIQSALQRFARPWYKAYALRIFRDETGLAANPALWPSIVRALDNSDYIVLLASPGAKASPWVSREVERFVADRSPEKILIVLTRGVIAWNVAAGDFDWTATTAIPECLRGRFRDQPLYVDLTWVDKSEQLSLRHAGFRGAVLDLAAPLHGRPKDDLDSEDIRFHRRTLRLAWSAVVLLSMLSIALAFAALYATRQRDDANTQRRNAEGQRRAADEQRGIAVEQRRVAEERRQEADRQRLGAEEERQIAISRQLSAQALNRMSSRLDLALLQSVQATLVRDTVEARSALLSSLFYSPHLRKFLWGEPGALSNAALSMDGRTLLELHEDNGMLSVRWIDVSGHISPSKRVTGIRGVRSVALTRDGARLAAAVAGRVVIRDVRNVVPARTLVLDESQQTPDVLTFSADGNTLAAYESSIGVAIWDLGTGRVSPLRPKRWETALAFSPDGRLLASGGNDGSIMLWNAATGQPMTPPLRGHSGRIFSLMFSRDGQVLASGSEDRTIRFWDAATGRPIGAPLAGHEPWPLGYEKWGLSVAFSPDGTILASAAKDGSIILWDVATRERLGPALRGHPTGIISVAFSNDGKSLVSVGQDGTVLVWAIEPSSDAAVALEGHGDGVLSLAFTQDGGTLAAATLDHSIMIWKMAAWSLARSPFGGFRNAVIGVDFPAGRNGLVAASGNQLTEWNLLTGRSRPHRPASSLAELSRIAFAPDGRFIAASDGVTLVLWDNTTETWVRFPIASASPAHEVRSLVFSPDSLRFASGGSDGTLALWDVRTRRLVRPAVKAHREAVQALAFSPDGGLLASAGVGTADFDDNVRLWDATALRQLLPSLGGHEGPVRALAFGRDGRMLAAAADDRIVLWQLDRRQRIGQPLTGHEGPIETLAFSPDGQWLASGGHDDRVLLWDLRLDSWRRRACRIANRHLDEAEWKQLIGDAPYEPACR